MGIEKPISLRENRVRKMASLYYSRKDIQLEIYKFGKNREVSSRYFDGFGKRPDTLDYPGDVFGLASEGATSLHCSEEIWKDPMKVKTGMTEKQLNELRIGWDFLIDIDCKWFDYSKIAAESIIKALGDNGIKNIGLKFSGSKGWHIIVPWKAFPEKISGEETKNLFPELPRKLLDYLRFESEKIMANKLPKDFEKQFRNVEIKKGVKCLKCNEIASEYIITDFFCDKCGIGEQRKLEKNNEQKLKCPSCKKEFKIKNKKSFYECKKCQKNSKKDKDNFLVGVIKTDLFELMGLDLVLISPRHLFRMPYSLHEKTSLASVVINPKNISKFNPGDADPLKIEIKDFYPKAKKDEAKEFVLKALDWCSMNRPKILKKSFKNYDYKKIEIKKIKDKNFPPCVKKILAGISDGKKRALFILINLFRSVGMEKELLEQKIYEWNKKNTPSLEDKYLSSQLNWSYKNKPILPPNCKSFYEEIGICSPDNLCTRIKNPTNYVVLKNPNSKKKNNKTKKYL